MIDFPASPTVGQQFSAAGVVWIWDGVKWLPSGLAPTVVPGVNDNRIINGDMRIDQRNNGAAGTAGAYTADRWYYVASQASKLTWQRGTGVAPGFPYQLGFNTSSAYTPLAADYFVITQPIEADMVSDFAFGTPQAQLVTLSFWVYSSLAGQFGGSLRNGAANNRGCPFAYSVPAANTWTKITVTIPGDTGGTWTLSGNSSGLVLTFDLGSGANVRGPAGVWASSPLLGANGSVNPVATNGASFVVTGVKLEIGSVATPYNRQSLAKSQADCERYFRWIIFNMEWQAGAAGNYMMQSIPLSMRAAPTMGASVVDPNATPLTRNFMGSGPQYTLSYGVGVYIQAAAAGDCLLSGYRAPLSAEL